MAAHRLRVRSQLELAPDLCAPAGVFGKVQLSAEQEQDVVFGWPVAKATRFSRASSATVC